VNLSKIDIDGMLKEVQDVSMFLWDVLDVCAGQGVRMPWPRVRYQPEDHDHVIDWYYDPGRQVFQLAAGRCGRQLTVSLRYGEWQRYVTLHWWWWRPEGTRCHRLFDAGSLDGPRAYEMAALGLGWMMAAPIEEPLPNFRRAAGDTVCACGRPYYKHPHTSHRDWNDAPYLHVLCNGDLVKL
jgi:hypothetical protein